MRTKPECRPVRFRRSEYGVLLAVLLIALSGCAIQKGSTSSLTPNIEKNAPPVLIADASQETIPSTIPAHEEEPLDPFAKPGDEAIEEYDPWEPFNAKVFEFNRQFDRWLLKPVATRYNAIVPNIVQVGISNFFYNTRVTPRLMNNLFQGKFKGAGIEVGRFLINTTIGVGGFFDVAQHFHLTTPEEDAGQTLGFYGVPPGPYLVVPLMPPFTVRDAVGYVGDLALNPIYWLVFPILDIHGMPSLLSYNDRLATSLILFGAKATEVVNNRSLNLEKYQGVEESTLDLYAAVRNAYLQKRAKVIQE
ncbi:MAG TPA: VacJ family lipoprotein [Nitrospira sp.]|nr:VacJ family lipoprotein [Nitrospira sp.]